MDVKTLSYIQQISLGAVPVLFSITVHEVSHGYVAFLLGDDTAKKMGRLTLNPIKHLDPLGILVFLITRIIGWAKPVPVNPLNLRNPKRDMIWVAFAGPASNIFLAVLFSFLFKALIRIEPETTKFFIFFLKHGLLPPLEGIYRVVVPVSVMLFFGVIINVALCLFNLIPVLPLDGGRILYGVLPDSWAEVYRRIEPFGIVIVVFLILFGGLDRLLGEFILKIAALLLGI